jgi:hypothetical protein
MRLFGGTQVSPELQGLLVDVRRGLLERFDAGFAARLPALNPDQRGRMVKVSLQIALAMLPLTLDSDTRLADAFAHELKAVLLAYWTSAFDESR